MSTIPTVWITGASSGIGRALALGWAETGAKLILSGRDLGRLGEVAKAVGGETLVLPFEVTDHAAMNSAVASALEWTGGVDVLVNNAGIAQRSLAVETALQVYRDIIEIDLMAPIALTQALLPHMAERGSGKLVFISSVAGKVGVPLRTAYCAAKHGLIGYADALRAELSTTGVDVHVIAPGSVATDVSRNALEASGAKRGVSDPVIDNGIPPDEAAAEILAGIAAGQREIIVARGTELAMAEMRRTPDELFDRIADMVAKGYIAKMEPQAS
ncbi:SDR family NAD(P)-dependent oxidoreductase [Allopontixanthobacter sp.]|uniref:SDR family NAD(P)-dependent oxidoreductase n=1 Tax=Allopontixanthobacter sp. TaxID=2906452 RepID=UPI002ABB42BA|nr:SDR family NAD(P)-dependent oxidoreductase [Allopontixanthobacter sp.]MDZ4308336.1 SDR family NAD(P)-dependent oxidoreductase [Allopontixanthobacter sp.]